MPSDTHVKLTIKALDRMQPGDVLRDVAIGGFFVERGKRPRVSLKIQADLPDGRTVKMTLGQHPGSSLDEVRTEALRLLTEIKAGRDPREPTAALVTEEIWTVRKAFTQYQADMEIRGKSKRTASDLDGMLKNLSSWSEIVRKSRRENLPTEFEDERSRRMRSTTGATCPSRRSRGRCAATVTSVSGSSGSRPPTRH